MLPVDHKPHFAVLVCPQTRQALRRIGDDLVTADGTRRYPVVRGVPRFVSSDYYVRSFTFEWNLHQTTQLDSHRQDSSSEDTFRSKTGLRPEDVRGKLVLDAGVGAGRFSEVLVRWGASVVGVDLSFAVEAAQRNLGQRPEALICQADIAGLPFRDATFDYIISIGVLHHTPDTKRYFGFLPRLLKPGGEVAIWVYPPEGEYLKRQAWVPFTARIPHPLFYRFCRVLVSWIHRHPRSPLLEPIRRVFPFSDQKLGLENDILDTFDAYSPQYHWTHSPEEVEGWFRELGLQDVRQFSWKTAVRGRRTRLAG